MKNTFLFLKLGLVSVWLIASLACGSQNQSGGNSSNSTVGNVNSNVAASNVNSNANAAANNAASETKANNRDPKDYCSILTDFVNSGEYKQNDVYYKCSGKKKLQLSSIRSQDFSFEAEGEAEKINKLSLYFVTETNSKENAEIEDEFVKSCEQLWFKVFAMPLPEEVSKAILSDKGKATEKTKTFTLPTDADFKTVKTFTEPAEATFLRHRTGNSYGLVFYFELPAK